MLRKGHFFDQYKVGKRIGNGGFGSVLRCTLKVSGELRAVKILKKKEVLNRVSNIETEFRILMDMDHPNIIKIFDIFETNDSIYIVQE